MNRRGFLRSILPAAVAGAAALRGCVLPGSRLLPPPDNTPPRDNVGQGLPVVREADDDTHIPASYVHQLREVLEADPRFEKVSMWEAERPVDYVGSVRHAMDTADGWIANYSPATGWIVVQGLRPIWTDLSVNIDLSFSLPPTA